MIRFPEAVAISIAGLKADPAEGIHDQARHFEGQLIGVVDSCEGGALVNLPADSVGSGAPLPGLTVSKQPGLVSTSQP